MALEIPRIEPKEITVGDRVQWARELADFDASEWTLTYYLRANGPGALITIAATDDDGEFSVDVAPAVSASWTPGAYFWQSFVAQLNDRKPIGTGRLVIQPDFSSIEIPIDGRSHYRRTMENIQLVIEGRSTHDQQRYVMQTVGRSVDKMPIADLLKFLDYYRAEVKAEDAAAALARGEATGRNVFIRFGTPS